MSAKFDKNNGRPVLVVIFKNRAKPHIFGSLASIFEIFSPAEIGCTLPQLWARIPNIGDRFSTDKCTIYRCPVVRKKQNR